MQALREALDHSDYFGKMERIVLLVVVVGW